MAEVKMPISHNCEGETGFSSRPFSKRWYVLSLSGLVGLVTVVDLLNGRFSVAFRHVLEYGAILFYLYMLFDIVQPKQLSPWWGLGAILPLVVLSLFFPGGIFRLVFTGGYILLGFISVLGIRWDRKRRRLR